MFRFFILLYGLSLTEAYTIKVSGKVELGNQLSKLFKDLYSQLAENGMIPADLVQNSNEQDPHRELRYELPIGDEITESDVITEPVSSNEKKIKKRKKKKQKHTDDTEIVKEIPVLDKMMKTDMEKVHLYGFHKFQDKNQGEQNEGPPLNNVHI